MRRRAALLTLLLLLIASNAGAWYLGLNIFDTDVSDIDYFYRSRLPGEPAEGVDEVHLHPALPRSAWAGLQVSFQSIDQRAWTSWICHPPSYALRKLKLH